MAHAPTCRDGRQRQCRGMRTSQGQRGHVASDGKGKSIFGMTRDELAAGGILRRPGTRRVVGGGKRGWTGMELGRRSDTF